MPTPPVRTTATERRNANAKQRINQHRDYIAQLQRAGHDTDIAEMLLQQMRSTLKQMSQTRRANRRH